MSNRRKPKSLSDITAQITPAEKIVSICVAGKLYAEHQRLERDLAEAQEIEVGRKINEPSKALPIAEEIRAIEDEMEAQTYSFTVVQIDRKRWRELLADHPTRNAMQEVYNRETFPPAAVAASCVDPVGFDDPAQFDPFWEKLGAGQDELFAAAWEVNQVGISVPFSVSASVILTNSAQTSTTAAP